MTDRCDILGLGCVAVDDLLYVDSYPAADMKVRVQRSVRRCGGQTANALIAAARLGAFCAYAGTLGEDELSHFVISTLAAEHVNPYAVRLARAARPIRSTIIVDRGKQTRTVFYNLEGVVPAQADHPDPSVIRSCRVLYVDQFGIEGMLRAARIAREAGIAVVGDLEDDSWPGFAELLDIIDHLILSHDFAERITGHADPARAARSLWNERRSIVVVTCGAAGCWYVKSDGDPAFQPAFPVVAADSTGCGDVFRGAYAVALSEWQALTDRVEFAAAAAALRAQLAEFPERAQVVSLLQCRP